METYKELCQILKSNSILFLEDSDVIELSAVTELLVDFFEREKIIYEVVQDNKCRIDLYQSNFIIFSNYSSFLERVNKNILSKDILIFEDQDLRTLYWQPSVGKTYLNFIETGSIKFFENIICYFDLLDFLKEQEHKEDNVFYFVDHFSWDQRVIVFTSLKKEGKLTLSFPLNVPNLQNITSFKAKIENFKKAFEEKNKHLPKFIKSELFNFLHKESKGNRFLVFIDKLDEIVSIAEQNFEIYLSDLTLDNLKKEYIEYKDKYYQQLRDILSKITSQIIALPLSITASAFATYKTFDNPFLLTIIIIAFFAFTIYSLFNLRLQLEDVKDIENSAEIDFNKIKSSNFFVKYPDELFIFENITLKIRQRVKLLCNSIYSYYFTLSITNLLFVSFAILQLGLEKRYLYFVITVLMLLSIFFFSFIFFYDTKNEDKH
ncbi:hypothetical protein [Rufibacter immobilis]|uniref:hypothetical protein n=1 Tax=Rufibacter immobilis TaxID=1348778 RepID=UPI0035E96BD7